MFKSILLCDYNNTSTANCRKIIDTPRKFSAMENMDSLFLSYQKIFTCLIPEEDRDEAIDFLRKKFMLPTTGRKVLNNKDSE